MNKNKLAIIAVALIISTAGIAGAADAPKAEPSKTPAVKPAKAAVPEPTYSGKNPKTMAETAGTQDNVAPEGFIAVFNGKDLTNWRGLMDPKKKLDNPINRMKLADEDRKAAQAEADDDMRAHWSVAEGALVFDGKGRSLATAKEFGDFEMWVTWKIKAGGDSGVYVRGSPQVQIWDTTNKKVARADRGSGALYNNEKNPRDALVLADNPIEQWNTFFIRMVGEKVTVYLNGKLVTDDVTMENYWDRTKPIFAKEQIELQNHGNTLWFKNVYVKELSSAAGK